MAERVPTLFELFEATDLSVKVGLMRPAEGQQLKEKALRAHDARVWDEGFAAGKDPRRYGDKDFWEWDDLDNTFYPKPGTDPQRNNPYRRES